MQTQDFITFRTYQDIALAKGLIAILEEHAIACLLVDESLSFNPSMTSNLADKEYRVVIRADEFEKVQTLLLSLSSAQLSEVDPDYYLFSFTNEELMDLLSKPDEWNEFDYALAPKLLKERGIIVTAEELSALRNKRWDHLYQPEHLSRFWLYLGYVTAFLGGLIGIYTGWVLAYSTKTLPNGQQVHRYIDEDRKHGKYMLVIGTCVLIAVLLLKLSQVK